MFPFGHLITGWVFGLIIQFMLDINLTAFAWVLIFIGSLLPDTDLVYHWFTKYKIHRTMTHSFLFILFVFFFTYFISSIDAAIFLTLGVVSHIFIDMFSSSEGVMLFWPMKINYSIYGKRNNSKSEFSLRTFLFYKFKNLFFDLILGAIWLLFFV